ncbi:MAG: MFS transporter [Thermoplasmata archaeon]
MNGVGPPPLARRNVAAIGLFLARVIYAVNWYNVGAVLPQIGGSFGIGTARLGVVLGAFLVGVGIFQIPAGFAALRFGARSVSLAGLAVMGAFCLASAASPNYLVLAALRFGAGVGAAFFFSPGLSLIASYFPAGERGPVIGLYNGGFSVGGAIGLFAGAILGEAFGWPISLALAGLVLLALTGVTAVVLPPSPARAGASASVNVWSSGRSVLRSRSIWALALSTTGFWGAIYIVAQYFVKYGEDVHVAWGLGLVAAMAGAVVLLSFPGGPFGGWIAERGGDRRLLLAVFTVLAGALTALLPLANLLTIWPILLLLGFFDGVVFAILYLVPTYLPESQGDGLALGVAVINSIQVLAGSALAVAFGVIASGFGYTVAWVSSGAICIALVPLLILVTPSRGGPSGRGAGGESERRTERARAP